MEVGETSMKKFLRLVYVQFKQEFKDVVGVAMMFFLPIIIVVAIFFTSSGNSDANSTLAIVNLDKGSLASEVVDLLSNDNDVKVFNNEEEAMDLLDRNQVAVVYVFDKNFSETMSSMQVPKVTSYRYESSQDTVIDLYDQTIQNFIYEEIKSSIYEQYGVDYQEVKEYRIIETNLVTDQNTAISESSIAMMMILYFMFMSNSGIATSLFKLKETKVLRRLMTTDNNQFSIIVSFVLSKFLFQVSESSLAFIVTNLIIGFKDIHFISFLLSSAMLSMVSISLSVFLARILKTESYISMVSIIITIIYFFAGFLLIIRDIFELTPIIEMIIQFSPFYWAYEMAIYHIYFPNIIILFLFALVFTTAGSYKLNKFIDS